jgi:hypothetical protein
MADSAAAAPTPQPTDGIAGTQDEAPAIAATPTAGVADKAPADAVGKAAGGEEATGDNQATKEGGAAPDAASDATTKPEAGAIAATGTAALLGQGNGSGNDDDDDDDDDDDFEDTPQASASAAGSVAAKEAGGGGGAEADAEEEEKNSGGAIAYMRGKLRMLDEDTVVYSGVWAMAKEDFADKTKTSKMHYETSLSETQLAAGDIGETSWDGFFAIKTGMSEDGKATYRKVKEEGIELSAEQGATKDHFQLKGSGVNEFGAFAIKGVFNRVTRQLMITRQYEADDDDDDVEDDPSTEEIAAELALLREEADMDLDALTSSGQLKKRKASGSGSATTGGGGAGSAPPAKRERRKSAIRAQNSIREKIAQELGQAAGQAPSGSGGDLQALAAQVKKLRHQGTAEQLMPLLRQLNKIPMTVAKLTATGIGSLVNKLAKKHEDHEVSELPRRQRPQQRRKQQQRIVWWW